MDAHATPSSRSQSPFFTIPFHLPRTRSSDNLGSSPGPAAAPPMPHSPLLDLIHRIEHFGESHPDWGPFRHHQHLHHHESPTPALIGDGATATVAYTGTSMPPNLHVIAPSPSIALAPPLSRSLTPFSLPHLAPQSPSSLSPPLLPRSASSTSVDHIPFTLSSKHGDGLIAPISAAAAVAAGGAPVVYESVAAAAASASHIAPPTCAHCGSSVTSGRPTITQTTGSKPTRPLIQVVVDTCKNCMDRVSETAARGVHRELGTPGRTPYVNLGSELPFYSINGDSSAEV
ncbi:hypothetical protein BCR44DRAFT_1423770 [Catenaria anguillulae PL171]|uniref:Uncharacterized protein n=1 Tax=Catenaria anguillulae PL171 TaxID=765915 RepID=A0A1Y2I1P5_9FUNG|nr:hypothetical protein BCR44DRAFT_1423770 [Catenaria anguillulae PL171]